MKYSDALQIKPFDMIETRMGWTKPIVSQVSHGIRNGKDVLYIECRDGETYLHTQVIRVFHPKTPPKPAEATRAGEARPVDDHEYERQAEYAEHCQRHEPTYNPEDGSM